MKHICPSCNKSFSCDTTGVSSATLDCPHCNTLLLWKDAKMVKFHETLNKENPSWPVEGKDTESVDV